MRKLLIAFVVLAFISCGKAQWSKEYLTKQCNKDFTKRNEKDKRLNETQIKDICDCISDKMIVKYKSQKEADKDTAGAGQMGTDCAMQVMMPPPMNDNTDTTTVTDTTGNQ